MAQAIHLINSPEIAEKIESPLGRVRTLLEAGLSPTQIIDQLFMATLSRPPTSNERSRLLTVFTQTDAKTATEDILWVLLNTKEFLYNH